MSHFAVLTLPTRSDARGSLTVLDGDLPFPIVRSFWIYGADGELRGGHRHHKTRMALIAVSGSVEVLMDDGQHKETILLDSPDKCLLVEPDDWHQMRFGAGAVLLVMASHSYDAADYIHEAYA